MVAIKSVTRSKLSDKLLENLEGEISILKSMRHTNIVDLRDCIYTQEHIHLIMEYCPGGDLSQYIKRQGDVAPWDGDLDKNPLAAAQRAKFPHPADGGLNDAMVRSFLAQLASAVRFLRSRDVVHRDIKPQNLLLQIPDDECLATGHPPEIPQIKLADFGFARSLPAASLAKTLCGSPLYMAPEILRYEKYDAKADLWSVGAVLYEMSVGRPPFRASNHVELLRRIEHGNDRIKFPDERSPQTLERDAERRRLMGETPRPPPHLVASDIKTLIRRLLRQNPVERISFDEFLSDELIAAVPYVGRAIIKDELAASEHLTRLPDGRLDVSILMSTQLGTGIDHETDTRTSVGFSTPPTSTVGPDVLRRPAPKPSALSLAIHQASDAGLTPKGASVPPNAPQTKDSFTQGSVSSKVVSAPATTSNLTIHSDFNDTLQSLAKKAYVLSEFGDARFAELQPSRSDPSGLSPAESSPNSAGNHLQETAAADSLALYVRALSFLQRGLDMIHAYARTVQELPLEVNELAQWFRTRFSESYEKSITARSYCHAPILPGMDQHLDRQIFDKALELARAAALEELEQNQNVYTWDSTKCVLAYETASSLLLGLLDPCDDRMGLSTNSVSTVEKFLLSITKRLDALNQATSVA